MPKIISFLLIALFCACSITQFNPATYEKNYLFIGHGGGITGLETNYYFLENGSLFKQEGTNAPLLSLGKIDKHIYNRIIENCDRLALTEYKYMEPRNTYRHLTIHVQEKSNRIVWSVGDQEIQDAVTTIYDILKDAIHE